MAKAWSITFTIRDAKGQKAYTSLWYRDQSEDNFDDAYTPWEIGAAAATELNAIINGVIESINVSFSVPLPGGLRTIPDSNSDVEEGLIVVYETAARTMFKQRIPTILEQYLPDKPRYEDFPAISFIDWMLHPEDVLPGAGAVLGPTDQRGLDLTRVRFYAAAFKASRKDNK